MGTPISTRPATGAGCCWAVGLLVSSSSPARAAVDVALILQTPDTPLFFYLKSCLISASVMLSLILATTLVSQAGPEPAPGPGVPEALAKERSESVRNLRYELLFVVPADLSSPVQGQVTIRFSLIAPHRVVLDFAQPAERVRRVRIAGADVRVTVGERPRGHSRRRDASGGERGGYRVCGGGRPAEPQRGVLVHVICSCPRPAGLPLLRSAGPESSLYLVARGAGGVEGRVERFRRHHRLQRRAHADSVCRDPAASTYLFAFVTGQFSVETATRNGRELRLFHRETDAAKVARNREAIFDLHAAALRWLEDYTAIPYPFGKFDVVAIPSFQFSGMEHPGAILYNAASVLLDESATQNQILDRANVISHETAHMWFGDLVTMRWFNDVWMKEVFANFMAGKIVNPSFPQVNHDLRFLLANYPGAYQVDRTAGTNAIRQPLANLDDAGQLYGAVIYQKAPIVMRQLETIVGETAFRDGLRRPRDLLVRKCDVARPRAHPGCTHQRRSRRVESRLGGGARPPRGPHGRAGG